MNQEEIIARNIVNLRKQNGKTQLDLAEALNYTYQAVSRWETNKSCPDAITLKALADYFNVSLDYFFIEHEEKDNKDKEKIIQSRKTIQALFFSFLAFISITGLTLIVLSAIPSIKSLLTCFIIVGAFLTLLLIFSYIINFKSHRLLIISLLLHDVSFIIFDIFKNEIAPIKWIFVISIILQIILIYVHNLLKNR